MLEDWEIHQMDVKSVFLNGLLDEEIFMEQPQGFITPDQPDWVCYLKKALYGLKQASHTWNLQFHGVLTELGFMHMHSDAGVYVYHCQDSGGISVFIILYVDDITLLGNSHAEINWIKTYLSGCYEMTDLDKIKSYLGVCITRERSIKRLEIDQSWYIFKILNQFRMADANPAHTPLPMGADVHLVKHEGQVGQSEIKDYQSLIGSLLYVQISMHPNISFAVLHLAQYAANPSLQHLRLAKYILSYLKGMVDYRLHYDGTCGDGLHGYSDSSLGDQADDYHSTSGFIFLMADATILWSSHKQKTVAQSTTQAEYMALTDVANQATWYHSFLSELGYDIPNPILLHGDNKGAVNLVLNPVTGRRLKHIPIKHHAICEYIEEGFIELVRTPTIDMLTDRFTKPHSHAQLEDFITGLGLV
jgi:Reverse transcriptase (RNA-dependent DNA polymerase)